MVTLGLSPLLCKMFFVVALFGTFSRGKPMPAHLVVQADNTAREMRNSCLVQWGTGLVLKNLFRSVTFNFMVVGHTHILVDQRFSIIATGLGKPTVMETPEDTNLSKTFPHHNKATRFFPNKSVMRVYCSTGCLYFCCQSHHVGQTGGPSIYNLTRSLLMPSAST